MKDGASYYFQPKDADWRGVLGFEKLGQIKYGLFVHLSKTRFTFLMTRLKLWRLDDNNSPVLRKNILIATSVMLCFQFFSPTKLLEKNHLKLLNGEKLAQAQICQALRILGSPISVRLSMG